MFRLCWTALLILTLLATFANGETVKSHEGVEVEFRWDGTKYVPLDSAWKLNAATGYYERQEQETTVGGVQWKKANGKWVPESPPGYRVYFVNGTWWKEPVCGPKG